jgi:hypothetical protein
MHGPAVTYECERESTAAVTARKPYSPAAAMAACGCTTRPAPLCLATSCCACVCQQVNASHRPAGPLSRSITPPCLHMIAWQHTTLPAISSQRHTQLHCSAAPARPFCGQQASLLIAPRGAACSTELACGCCLWLLSPLPPSHRCPYLGAHQTQQQLVQPVHVRLRGSTCSALCCSSRRLHRCCCACNGLPEVPNCNRATHLGPLGGAMQFHTDSTLLQTAPARPQDEPHTCAMQLL